MSDERQPWLENWIPETGGEGIVKLPGVEPGRFGLGRLEGVERAKLAAAAPEMARMLLWLSGRQEGERRDPDQCASCGGEVEKLDGGVVHLRDCSLLALLRKAGVLP